MRVEGDKLLHEAPEPPNDHSLNSIRDAAAAYVIAEKSPPPSAASAASAACALTLMGRTVGSTGGAGTAAGAATASAASACSAARFCGRSLMRRFNSSMIRSRCSASMTRFFKPRLYG